MATQQVGLLTPLVYRLDHRLGILQLLDRARGFGGLTFEAVGNWGNSALGLAVPSGQERAWATIQRHVKLTAETARLWYGQDFAASPTADVLRAFSDDLRGAGVTILYVVAPVQRRILQQFGVQPADLHARTERLREMLHASPEQWLDTSELFQETDFIDGVHVRGDLVRRFAPPVIERLSALMPTLRPPGPASIAGQEHEKIGASLIQ